MRQLRLLLAPLRFEALALADVAQDALVPDGRAAGIAQHVAGHRHHGLAAVAVGASASRVADPAVRVDQRPPPLARRWARSRRLASVPISSCGWKPNRVTDGLTISNAAVEADAQVDVVDALEDAAEAPLVLAGAGGGRQQSRVPNAIVHALLLLAQQRGEAPARG